MKVHFLIPSTAEFGQQEVLDRIYGCNYGFFAQPNIFVLQLATLVKKAGYPTVISDCVVEKINLDTALKRGGQVFIFYSVFLSRRVDLEVARKIRSKYPKSWFIFLGNDPVWFLDKYVVTQRHMVIRGEPELVIEKLLAELAKKQPNLDRIKGISWLKNKKLVHNPTAGYLPDINRLPIPDRLLLPKPFIYANARFSQFPSTTMMTSRGCSYRCLFCLPNSLSFAREIEYKNICGRKPPVKARTAGKVIEEFKLLSKLGFKSVSVVDDQFLWDRRRTDKILDGIRNLNLEISILARCDRITDYRLAKQLYQSGIHHIAFGVESFHQPILDYIQKDLKVAQIKRSIDWCLKAGIEPEINIIIGSCPLETKETIANTLDEVEKLKVDIVHVNIITPFPGTEYAKLAKKEGWMTVPEYRPVDSSAQSLISYPHLSDKELVAIIKAYLRRHYFSPGYLWRQLRQVKSAKDLISKVGAGINEFRLLMIK